MPSILVQIAYLIIFVWSVMKVFQDLQVARKDWITVLLYASVAVVSLHFFLTSVDIRL